MHYSTRQAEVMAKLFGGESCGVNGFTHDEIKSLEQLYGFDPEADENPLMAAGSRRNLFRYATRDGLRVMAFLARYCEPGEDPVQLVAEGLVELGYDCELEDDEEEE